MNVRDKINQVTREYKRLLVGIDGEFTEDEQEAVFDKLEELGFWTRTLMIVSNHDLPD